MSLDNIHFPAIVIQNLFKNSLIDVNSEQSIKEEDIFSLNFLGDNAQKIIILVNNDAEIFVSDSELNFLVEILNACKLNLADIALVNVAKYPAADYQSLKSILNAEIVIMFDVKPSAIKLPFNIPLFQVQSFNNQRYLPVPSLNILEKDKELKRKIWLSLKQIFSL